MPFGLPSLTKSAAWLGLGVLLLAALAVGYQAGQWAAPERAPRTDTVTVAEPMGPGDILEATTPRQVTEHDTSETSQECIEVPTWLASTQRSRTQGSRIQTFTGGDSLKDSGLQQSRTTVPTKAGLNLGGPTYAITPLTQGSPSLSVGKGEVTLSGYLPDGRGRQWTYRIPQDSWHLWPSVRAASTPTGLQASALANLRWRRVTVSAGYMQAGSSRGVAFGVELRPFTVSW